MRSLIAHSAPAPGLPNQPLFDAVDGVEAHAAGVARRAAEFAAAFGSERVAAWLGWWHDAGKVAPDVQAYLHGETDAKKGPDHSSAGMLAAVDTFAPLAFVIAGHHGGLADHEDLKSRTEKKRGEARVTDALRVARGLVGDRAPSVSQADMPAHVRSQLALDVWVRMLHSALVDADCLDSEAFGSPEKAALRERGLDLAPLWEALDADQQALMARSTGDVNAARADVYRACVAAADGPPGVYSLTVPTGGGKTRSAMAFALRHALRHGQRRVIVALPYTSIIEQNADVYRGLFDAVNADAVLEHHSAVASRERANTEDERETRDRLAGETWDAPVVVTTTVQLLESLFANRNSRLRKLHRIARSVVVLDEVQTLPPSLLVPTLDMLRHLVEAYGVTALLCTATPPALVSRDGFAGFDGVTEIVADPKALFGRLARVSYRVEPEPWTWDDAARAMRSEPQALAILNTKRDATALLDALAGDPSALYLSTQLCGAHRRAVLAEVRRRLRPDVNEPVRLVSTQVVEAGVDLDFPLVLRALGPLDGIVQAAGRCNREGRLDRGRVVVFRPVEGGMPPGAYRAGAQTTDSLLTENPDLDFDDPASALDYFARLYSRQELDKEKVQALRSALKFEQTARAYRLIDDEAVPVVVPYPAAGPAAEAREAVLKTIGRQGQAYTRDFRALQPYVVNLRERAHQEAVRKSMCVEVAEGVWRWTGHYDVLHGLVFEIAYLTDSTDGTVI